MNYLKIKGAKEHNLKNISVDIPKNQLVVFTGISGSGKSSLAFDTIYAEGQRRYVESLSPYARQFLGVMHKPNVDFIEGLSPAICVSQKGPSHNPRSTVGTTTEIYDYLRLLFARIGHPHCPSCGREIKRQSPQEIINKIVDFVSIALNKNNPKSLRVLILSPVIRGKKGEFCELFNELRSKGYQKIRVDKVFFGLDEDFSLIKTNQHNIDVVVDRLVINNKNIKEKATRSRLSEAVETGLNLSQGLLIVSIIEDKTFSFPEKPKKFSDYLYSEKFSCPVCNLSFPEIEPRSFSFNSPFGACSTCAGLGSLVKINETLILNPNLSISEGGILPFSRTLNQDTWFRRTLEKAGEKSGFSLKTPIKNLKKEILKIILYGTGEATYRVTGLNRYNREVTISTPFKGIIPELEARLQESDDFRFSLEKFMEEEVCPDCQGARLKKETLSITLNQKNIYEVSNLTIDECLDFFKKLAVSLTKRENKISELILKEIVNRLEFLTSVGLDYLSLGRRADTLARGEAQRIQLASQIGSGLTGVLYVLDEPTIGLHQRDNHRLVKTLNRLRDLGNTIIVVEHDRVTIEKADWLVDFGPKAGGEGGRVIFEGTPEKIKNDKNSLTGQYLSGRKKIKIEKKDFVSQNQPFLIIEGCQEHNLKNLKVSFPLGKFICVTGVSGSGKSTLINETLFPALQEALNYQVKEKPGKFTKLSGSEYLHRVSMIDQSPIGRTPRSNPVTYTGAFNFIREFFSLLTESRIRGFKPGRFSFNVRGGRCETCQGKGQIEIKMNFLPDVYIECEVCKGTRFNEQTLEVKYKNKNISQILDLTVDEAYKFFINIPGLKVKLETLKEVGLGYIKLGQPATTLSGGEAQRIKLASELCKRSGEHTLYLLDEPTTGLHFHDLNNLIKVLHKLVSLGNTVIVIEHNLDIVKNADWIIDLGPEGGKKGGGLIASGKPEDISKIKNSYTGQFLKKVLNN